MRNVSAHICLCEIPFEKKIQQGAEGSWEHNIGSFASIMNFTESCSTYTVSIWSRDGVPCRPGVWGVWECLWPNVPSSVRRRGRLQRGEAVRGGLFLPRWEVPERHWGLCDGGPVHLPARRSTLQAQWRLRRSQQHLVGWLAVNVVATPWKNGCWFLSCFSLCLYVSYCENGSMRCSSPEMNSFLSDLFYDDDNLAPSRGANLSILTMLRPCYTSL